MIRQGDLAGLVFFAEHVVGRLPPRGTLAHWTELVRRLAAQPSGKLSAASEALDEVAASKPRRGLVILVSDLLVDDEATRRALKRLRHQGHELLVFHILDPGELELPAAGDAIYVDPESGDEITVRSAELRSEYREAVAAAIDGWRRTCGAQAIDYHPITTDQPLALCLGEYLYTRARLG